MFEKFEEIFWMVGERHNLLNWWNIFDSEVFDEVCEAIAFDNGWAWRQSDEDWEDVCRRNSADFVEWVHELSDEL